MGQGNVYGIDCGTTNWRIHRLAYTESDGIRRPRSQPQPVALTFFTGAHLPAALLLNEEGKVLHYGNNAYQEARNPSLRLGLRDAFKLCIGNQRRWTPGTRGRSSDNTVRFWGLNNV